MRHHSWGHMDRTADNDLKELKALEFEKLWFYFSFYDHVWIKIFLTSNILVYSIYKHVIL